jgi:L-rhamnonate dehydratase
MDTARIVRVEWGRLEGQRPRIAGANARLGIHGDRIGLPLVRLTTDDGATGFGLCRIGAEQAESLLGTSLENLFSLSTGVTDAGRAWEYPLWDLVGKRTGKPVYALTAAVNGAPEPAAQQVPTYDTSLYFDDLHLETAEAAAQLIADEARDGFARGHRAFKIKVGRGGRHLPLTEGTERDIAIIRAVHETVGPECPVLLDANNGYNLNLTKHVLKETADCNIFWMEEAFHEDDVLYRNLKEWLTEQDLPILIADGEGDASPRLLDWAKNGLVDVIQYDIFGYGLTRWLHLGKQLDHQGVRSAPHHYGAIFGNYVCCHIASAVERFTFVEWDEAATPGLDASGYIIENGKVNVPETPGFGLTLDESIFQNAIATGGGTRQSGAKS